MLVYTYADGLRSYAFGYIWFKIQLLLDTDTLRYRCFKIHILLDTDDLWYRWFKIHMHFDTDDFRLLLDTDYLRYRCFLYKNDLGYICVIYGCF